VAFSYGLILSPYHILILCRAGCHFVPQRFPSRVVLGDLPTFSDAVVGDSSGVSF
jgi:hypothetical protein